MMRTIARLLKEAYPVMLLISLLMGWELSTQGSRRNSFLDQTFQPGWNIASLKHDPACKYRKPNQIDADSFCAFKQDSLVPTLPRNPDFPRESASSANVEKTSPEQERL